MEQRDPTRSPAYQLWLASNAWQRAVRKALVPFRLTHVQFIILASIDLLGKSESPLRQTDVAHFADLDENMTSQVLRTLMGKNLVIRRQHPEDGRAHTLELTEEGRVLAAAAREAVRPVSTRFFEPLGSRSSEFTDLLRLLTV